MEGEGGYFRRNHLVPIPNVGGWEEFDALLSRFPKEDEQQIIGEPAQSAREGMLIEREHLQALKEGFDLAAVHSEGERERLREGVDQFLFHSSTSRRGREGESASRLRGDLT